MVPNVGRQRAALGERLPADLTDVRPLPAVDPPVPPQSAGSREGLPADAAGVRFDARVAPHVGLYVLEGVAADVANLTFLPVALKVVGQSFGRQQTLATDSTDRLRRVALGMFPKISSAPKSLPTDFAAGWWTTRHLSVLTLWIRTPGVLYGLCVFSPLWTPGVVDPPVSPQSSRPGKPFATDGTAVRLEPRVHPHVHLHVLESLPTDAARPTSLPVRLQVSL